MKMNSITYIIAVLNPLLLNSKNVTVRLGPLQSLAYEVTKLPDTLPEAFKDKGYQRVGDKGIYVSQNLREYIYNGIGEHDEEGFILRLDFTKLDTPNDSEPIAYVLQRPDFDDGESEAVDQYIRNQLRNRRSSRLVDKP